MPDGYYYLPDREIRPDEDHITLVNAGISIQAGLNDQFERDEEAAYSLQILDVDGNVLAETLAEAGETSAKMDASKLKAGEKYLLHANTEMFFPDREFEVPLYEAEMPLEVVIDYELAETAIRVLDASNGEWLADVTLQVMDPNEYAVAEYTTESAETEDDACQEGMAYSLFLMDGIEYTVKVTDAPDHYLMPEEIKFTAEKSEENVQQIIDISLVPYTDFSLNVQNVSGESVSGSEYALFADEECTQIAKTADGAEALLNNAEEAEAVKLANGTYFLKETEHAEHFYANGEVYAIEIDAHGEKEKVFDIVLVPVRVRIDLKNSENGSVIENADVQLCSEGNVIHQWSGGHAEYNDLDPGTAYTLKVQNSIPGYYKPSDIQLDIPLYAQGDGTVSKTIGFVPFTVMIRCIDSDYKTAVMGNIIQLKLDNDITREWTSENGYTSINGLYSGNAYTIHVKDTADHYLAASDFSFAIPGSPQENNTFYYDISVMPYVTGNIIVTGNGKAVGNVGIGIYSDPDCSKIAQTLDGKDALLTADPNGRISFDIRNGTYYVKEISFPQYYYHNNTVYVMKADRRSSPSASLEMACKPVSYRFSVTDGSSGVFISNARIRLKDSEGHLINEWTTGQSEISGIQLETGKMYVLEQLSAPSGYVKGGRVMFSVPEEEPGSDYELITIRDAGYVSYGVFLARSDVTTVPLANGKYGLFADKSCTRLITTIEGSSTVAVTDSHGNIHWNIFDGTYYLKELGSPEHFYLDPLVYEVTVSHHSDQAVITRLTNIPVTFFVSTMHEGSHLEGATVQVFDQDGIMIDEWTSNGERHMMDSSKLVAGYTYRIHCKSYPEKYKPQAEDLYFTVPDYEPSDIPTLIITFEKEPEKDIEDEPEETHVPEPVTPEQKMEQADHIMIPAFVGVSLACGLVLYVLFKRKKKEDTNP